MLGAVGKVGIGMVSPGGWSQPHDGKACEIEQKTAAGWDAH
jgi:hypothetical protein